MTRYLFTSPTRSIARHMPFSPAGEDRGKYIQFQQFALNRGSGPTAAPQVIDRKPHTRSGKFIRQDSDLRYGSGGRLVRPAAVISIVAWWTEDRNGLSFVPSV